MQKIICIFLLILPSSFLYAQWQPEIKLNEDLGASIHNYRCMFANGNYVHVVWSDNRNGNPEIYYKKSINNGVNWLNDFRITNSLLSSTQPSISVSGSIIHIVWTEGWDIYYKRSIDNGNTWTQNINLTNNTITLSNTPSISSFGLDVQICYQRWNFGNWAINYMRSIDNGLNWEPERRLDHNNSAYPQYDNSSISIYGSRVIVVWQDNLNNYIYYKRSLDKGINWTQDHVLIANNSTNPSLFFSGVDAYVVFQSFRDGNSEIYYKRSLNGGDTWEADVRVTNDPSQSSNPVLCNVNSEMHLVWKNNLNGISNILYQHSTNNGLKWNSSIQLSSVSNSSSPAFTLNNGTGHLVFTDLDSANIFYKQNSTLSDLKFVKLISPNSNNFFVKNSMQQIQWLNSIVSNLKIELSTDSGISWTTIANNVPSNLNNFYWTIPDKNSGQCKIKISDQQNPNIFDISDSNFTISNKSVDMGLLAYYPLNFNADDYSENNYQATLQNSPIFVSGKINNGLKINGNNSNTGSHLLFPAGLVNNINNSFSIFLWVKEETMWSYDGEAYFWIGEHSTGWIGISHFNDQIQFSVGSGSTIQPISIPFNNDDLNKFILYGLTYENGILKAYKNGKLVGEKAQSKYNEAGYSGLGKHWWNFGMGQSTRFSGIFDEVRIYNRCLPLSEVQQLFSPEGIFVNEPNENIILQAGLLKQIRWTNMTGGNVKLELSTNGGSSYPIIIANNISSNNNSYNWLVPNYTSSNCKIKISNINNPNIFDVSDNNFIISNNNLNNGLVAYYPFTGNTNDESGNGNNGINNGASLTNDRFGNPNKAYYFNGVNNWINIPDNSFLDFSDKFTISGWFKTDADLADMCIVGKGRNVGLTGYNILITINKLLSAGLNNNSVNSVLESNLHPQVGTWYFFAATYGGDSLKIFVNNALNNKKFDNLSLLNSTQPLNIGREADGLGRYFKGSIDDIRLYNRTLSNNEILQLYSGNYLGLTKPISGETYFSGQTLPITWETNLNETVLIQYSFNDGTNWTSIPMSIPSSSKNFNWQIPNNVNSENCRIKISIYNNPQIASISPKFTIKTETPNDDVVAKFKLISPSELGINKVVLKEDKFINHSITKPVVNNEINFTKNDFLNSNYFSAGSFDDKTDVLEFYNGESFKGRFILNILKTEVINNKKIDAIIYVDSVLTGVDAGYTGNGWKYYKSGSQRVISMLIPPKQSFNSINLNKPALLLVHGINSIFPSWFKLVWDIHDYDVWQFYYPHDQKIEISAKQLKKSIYQILKPGGPLESSKDEYPNNAVKIVAHSMGGLITRQCIQYEQGNQIISKLLMLGTPNNGSYSTYRLKEGTLLPNFINSWKVHTDTSSPAAIQLTMGSDFLINLNRTSAVKLKNITENYKGYLVIAGTEDCTPPGVHEEIGDQDDGVVSVSSARMLYNEIPLATTNLGHVQAAWVNSITELDHHIVENFINDNYDPSNQNNQQYLSLKNNSQIKYFWYRRDSLRKSPIIFDKIEEEKGIIIMATDLNEKFNFEILIESNHSKFIIINNDNKLNFNKIGEIIPNKFSNYYFSNNKVGTNEIGIKIKNPVRKTVEFRNSNSSSFKSIQKNFYPIETNYLRLNFIENGRSNIFDSSSIYFTPAETKIFLANNYMFENTSSLKTFRKDGSRGFSEEYYFDNSMDSIAIIINGNDNDANFVNHNFHLISPTNTIIDSNYANSHPGFSYVQNIEGKFAYYFIANPDTGIWSVNYNSLLNNPAISIPINSPISLNFIENDSAYEAGDSIKIELIVNGYQQLTNFNLESIINYSGVNNDTILYTIPLNFIHIKDSLFRTQFLADESGNYKIQSKLDAVFNGENIRRMSFEHISVTDLNKPLNISPKNDSTNTPINIKFVWKKSKNATSYNLQIFNIGDTIPIVINNIVDTIYNHIGFLNNATYFWKVMAISKTDSSEYSDVYSFTTNRSVPLAPILANPSNNSGGVFSPFEFNWDRAEDANSYIIQISSSVNFKSVALQDTVHNDTLINISGLEPLSRYYWRIKSVNEVGESEFSPEFTFRTMGTPFTITQSFPVNEQNNIPVYYYYLNWNKAMEQVYEGDNPNFVNYHLKITNDTTSNIFIINDSTLTDTIFIGNSLSYETKYFWKLRAENNAGWSEFSNWSSFTTSAPPLYLDSSIINTGNNIQSILGNTKLTFISDNQNSSDIKTNYFVNPPIAGTLPAEIHSVSKYYWFVKNNALNFSNGRIKVPLNSIGGVSDSSKLRWLKRENPGDEWLNIGGTINNGFLESNIPFNSLSEFAIGSLDSQSLSSGVVKITFLPSGLYNPVSNSLNLKDTFSIALKSINSPFNTIDSGKIILDSITFSSYLEFLRVTNSNYYLVIYHRNSLQTWSKNGGEILTIGDILKYDFTQSNSQSYGNNLILINSKWCIMSGDLNQDGFINGNDFTLFASQFGSPGYLTSDLNGDGVVNGNDFTFFSQNFGRQALFPNTILLTVPTKKIKSHSE